ncbi:hypothetical protein CIW49_12985 [Mycolicibacterium sp. P1-18]|uniref:hypothetical protein n=1 Tax=Mycolicibacterium sp. P1-18 TaxID=2024615 RepID=UPI00125B7662|nr:hypothetical protein CIW49_12985 [Mycolicibacterium sp. P1-18]
MTYSEARSELSKAGMQVVVATVVGDQVARNKCYVVNASRITSRNSSGEASSKPAMELALSCYKGDADGKNTGFSAGDLGIAAVSVRAKEAEAARKWRATTDAGQKYCAERAASHPERAPEPGCEPS